MNNLGGEDIELWDAKDGFYYDVLHLPNGKNLPLKVRSMVGLIPLFAVETLEPDVVDQLPGFKRRMQWFIENRPDLSEHIETEATDDGPRRFLSLVNRHRLKRVLRYMLDENEFLVALRHPRPVALSPRPSLHSAGQRHGPSRRL